MSLIAGAVALRHRNVMGAVRVHAGYDLLIFMPLAGRSRAGNGVRSRSAGRVARRT